MNKEIANKNLRGVDKELIKAAAKAAPLKLAMKIYNSVCGHCRLGLMRNPRSPKYCDSCKIKVQAILDDYNK